MRHRRPGAYQIQAAIAALHASAKSPELTDWSQIEFLYRALERMEPSPVVTLNGGKESDCGWCKDRWGFSWQITPRRLMELTTGSDRDKAKRAVEAMMTMKKIDIAALEAAAKAA